MKRVLLILVLTLFASGLFAYSFIYGGSNFSSYLGYPEFSYSKPSKPWTTYEYLPSKYTSVETVSEWEYDSYKSSVESYVQHAKEYIENCDNDIKRIREAQQQAIDDANNVIDEFNSWASNVYIK